MQTPVARARHLLLSACLGAALLAFGVPAFGSDDGEAPPEINPEGQGGVQEDVEGLLLGQAYKRRRIEGGIEAVTHAMEDPTGQGAAEGIGKTFLRKGGKIVCVFPCAVAESFSPDGRYLLLREAMADDECLYFLWDLHECRVSEKIGGRYGQAKWSKNSKILHFLEEVGPDGELGENTGCDPEKLRWKDEKRAKERMPGEAGGGVKAKKG